MQIIPFNIINFQNIRNKIMIPVVVVLIFSLIGFSLLLLRMERSTGEENLQERLEAGRTDLFVGPVAVAEDLMTEELAQMADAIS